MSLTVKFYNNSSNPRKMDKNLTHYERYDGGYRLKDGTSVQNPTLLCEASNGELQNNTNYFYIEDFERYYFITDITIVPGGLMEISGHCDVLTTAFKRKDDDNKSRLGKCQGILYRSETDYNLYIDDGYFKVKNNPKVQTKKFPNGFDSHNLVLVMAGT